MDIKQAMARAICVVVPPRVRIAVRGSRPAQLAIRTLFGGTRSLPLTDTPYRLHFDGFRSVGFLGNSLKVTPDNDERTAVDLIRRLQPSCVWDVGANIGIWSMRYAAALLPARPRFVCFEPDPANRTYLTMNRDRNDGFDWVIRDVALSDRAGEMSFTLDPLTGSTGSLEQGEAFITRHYGQSTRATRVAVSTIDAEVAAGMPVPQFIKIDVEGHELGVLRGGIETLRTHRPPILMEATRNEDLVAEILASLDYRLVDPNTGEPIPKPQWATLAIPA